MAGEAKVLKRLRDGAEARGIHYRRVSWAGRNGAPDVLLMGDGWHAFVECKAPGGVPTDTQLREHNRLRAAGLLVVVLSSVEAVDRFFEEME